MGMKKMLAVVGAALCVAVGAPALAANPFSDVPRNHWAYDAVASLAASGVLSGYPDGTFKGGQAMTRYEIASTIARALANKDYATQKDMDTLKALVVEFQPELENLGVTVDGFDARLTSLEKGVGGWKIWGLMQFDNVTNTTDSSRNTTYFDEAQIWLSKRVSDKITFTTKLEENDDGNLGFALYFAEVQDIFAGFNLTVGSWEYDWEDEDGLYADNDSIMGDNTVIGFKLDRLWGNWTFSLFRGEDHDTDGMSALNEAATGELGYVGDSRYDGKDKVFLTGARLKYNFNEKTFLSLNALFQEGEYASYWAAAGFKFAQDSALKGVYYWQKINDDRKDFLDEIHSHIYGRAFASDDPRAFRVMLDIGQDDLKFTSLWLEYAKYDEGFHVYHNDAYNFCGDMMEIFEPTGDGGIAFADVELWFVYAKQQWNEKWNTFERYLHVKGDNMANMSGVGYLGGDWKITNWTVGVGYQYSPNLYFELAYNDVKSESNLAEYPDRLIRLRTVLEF